MENYKGHLRLSCDGLSNKGAIKSILNYVRLMLLTNNLYENEEEDFRKTLFEIGLQKLTPEYEFRMGFNNFRVESCLGTGSLGSVWKVSGINQGPTGNYAMKQLRVEASRIQDCWKERDLLIDLKHDGITKIFGAFYQVDLFIITELCYGSIANLRIRISEKNALRFAFHLLEAVEWIHYKGVLHANIHPKNCLVSNSNKLVLSNFRRAIILPEGEAHIQGCVGLGSPGYLDLEALEDFKFSRNTDIFGSACVIFEMLENDELLFVPECEQSRNYYADIHRNGRFLQDQNMREQLTVRVKNSILGSLLIKMIASNDRISAAAALVYQPFLDVLHSRLEYPQDIVRVCEDDLVTEEYSEIRKKKFYMLGNTEANMDFSLIPFYYDIDDTIRMPGDASLKAEPFHSRDGLVNPRKTISSAKGSPVRRDETSTREIQNGQTTQHFESSSHNSTNPAGRPIKHDLFQDEDDLRIVTVRQKKIRARKE